MASGARRTLAGTLTLGGGLALLIGFFLPWIIRVDYLAHVDCPTGPHCPPPTVDSRSYVGVFLGNANLRSPQGWLALLWAAFLLLIVLQQGLIAVQAWQGRAIRSWLIGGLLSTLVAFVLYALASWLQYCVFFCGWPPPAPGVFHVGTGLLGGVGIRALAPGFWLLLAGVLISLGCDVALLVGLRRRTREAQAVSRDAAG